MASLNKLLAQPFAIEIKRQNRVLSARFRFAYYMFKRANQMPSNAAIFRFVLIVYFPLQKQSFGYLPQLQSRVTKDVFEMMSSD